MEVYNVVTARRRDVGGWVVSKPVVGYDHQVGEIDIFVEVYVGWVVEVVYGGPGVDDTVSVFRVPAGGSYISGGVLQGFSDRYG